MKPGDTVKSISYCRANLASIVDDIHLNDKTYIVTKNGEPMVAMQDIKVYKQMQGALAMLKLLSMSSNGHSNAKEMTVVFDELNIELEEM